MDMTEKKAVWPGWETVRLIGRGSFGAVYEIERDMLGEKEKAALKVISIPENGGEIEALRDEGYDDASITGTFKEHLKSIVAEYALMRRLNGNTNVVNCDDVRYVQHEDGFGWDIFIKMELLTPMKKVVGKKPTDEEVARLGADICRALTLCRNYSIVHRDIKPDNIFVSDTGDFKLGDFGVAKTMEKTSGGTKIGTYEYMAPEVYRGQPYGATADIYSLGMVLYWLLNERRAPFLPQPPALPTVSEKEQARLRRFAGEALPAPAHGGEALRRIVLKACAYEAKDRYQSAEDMLRELEALDRAQSVSAAPAGAAASRPRSAPVSPREETETPPSAKGPTAPPAGEPEEATVYDPPTAAEEATFYDPPTEAEDDGTVGVFHAEKQKAAPAGAAVSRPRVEKTPDEDATVADRTVYTPKAAKSAPQPTPAAPAAPAKKKKFPVWIPIVGVLAVAAAVLAIVLLKGGKETPLFRTVYTKQVNPDGSVTEYYYYYDGDSGSMECFRDGVHSETYQLTLNEKGQIAVRKRGDSESRYEYDKYGNVCKTWQYREGLLYSYEQIEYSPYHYAEKQLRFLYDEDGNEYPYTHLEMTDLTHGVYGVYDLENVGEEVDRRTIERTFDGNYLLSQSWYDEEGNLLNTFTWEERDEYYNWLRYSISYPDGRVATYEQVLERIGSGSSSNESRPSPVSAGVDYHEELRAGTRDDLWDIKNRLLEGVDVYRDLIFEDGSPRAAFSMTEDRIELLVYQTGLRYTFWFDNQKISHIDIQEGGDQNSPVLAWLIPVYVDESKSSTCGYNLYINGEGAAHFDDQYVWHRVTAGDRDCFFKFMNLGDSSEQTEFELYDSNGKMLSVYIARGNLLNQCFYDEYGFCRADIEFREEKYGGYTDIYLYADISDEDPKTIWRTYENRRFGSDGDVTKKTSVTYYDANHNVVETFGYDDNGRIRYHSYYDSDGNWQDEWYD